MIRLLILALWLWPSQASPPTLIITQHGLERLTITWSGAPGGAQVVYGKAVVGAGTSGSIDIPPAQIYPGRAAVLLGGDTLVIAQAMTQGFTARWEGTRLHVVWGAPEPGCLVLSGGPPDQLLADIPCATAGDVLLLSGGVDQAYAPQRYQRIELRRQADVRQALASAPTWRLVLPSIVRQ